MVRGKPREDAILAAAMAVLTDVGYQALTMDAVAARAHASKTTIYRRWRSKAALVKAALDAYDSNFNDSVPDTGSLRGDLFAVMEMLRRKAEAFPLAMIHGLITAMRDDEELAAALQAHLDDDELSPFTEPLHRAAGRGDVHADVDTELVHDIAEAMILRQLHVDAPFDDAFITRVVDDVLLALLTQGESPS
ncbi:TetR/AcrR family transcriptional regulator [Streptomyces sp. NPDC001922]|uniref:TetR/AcrR family transcriptional regulator n=1 Tax=Streptomyces sp. NPDC001922 TaxID=3364624 RepID=UPI0036803076